MLRGIDIKQRIEYISPSDTSEPKTIFVLKPLSALEMLSFTQLNETDQSAAFAFFLQKSIVEIKNFDTSDVKESIEMLPFALIGELMVEINKINNLSKAESKNL